jgi:hypothetical protein
VLPKLLEGAQGQRRFAIQAENCNNEATIFGPPNASLPNGCFIEANLKNSEATQGAASTPRLHANEFADQGVALLGTNFPMGDSPSRMISGAVFQPAKGESL